MGVIPEKVLYGLLVFIVGSLLIPLTKQIVKMVSDKFESRFKDLEEDNISLKNEIKSNNEKITYLDKQVSIHEKELANQDKKVDKLYNKVEGIDRKVDDLPTRILDLMKKVRE